MKVQAVIATALICGSLTFAQMGAGRGGPGRPHQFGIHSGKTVTGLPYSAQVSSVSLKTLADGNSLQKTTTGVTARDSLGRTYTQETITGLWGQGGAKTLTFISDPVAGYSYTLNAETKIAVRRVFHERTQHNGSEESPRPERPNTTSIDLGEQTVNGVAAQGKKVTHTIPAGEMGNAQPIVSTRETWYSPELQIVVSSKSVDLREGTSTYTLNNIQRSEPSAAMFQVPSEYTVKDAPNFSH